MLEKRKLDDSSYDNIYEKALQRIDRQAPWWTHREISDPGITLVEMWALLCDMQSFYMDQVQESHYRKYLKLLGIKPDEGEYASVWVFFDQITEDIILPEGTRLCADTMIFETAQEVKLTANRLTAFYLGEESPDEESICLGLMNRFRKTSFWLREGEVLFTLVLQDAVAAGDVFSFFVLLDEKSGRTEVSEDFCMAPIVWEYLTEWGYQEAYVEKDDTKGLLYSGYIHLRMQFPMSPLSGEGGYLIRCRIKEEDKTFDVMPVIYRIFLNMVQVYQKNTLYGEEYASFQADDPKISLKSYLALTGDIKVYAKCGEGEWADFTEHCEITPPVTAEQRTRSVIFDKRRFHKIPAEGPETVKIVCSLKGVRETYPSCDITGVSTQQISLPWENLRRDSVRLMLRQGKNTAKYREYFRTDPEEDRYRFVWHWQEEKNVIELGDGRHGEIPPAAEEGLQLTSLVLWEGEQGNVAVYKIRAFERPDLFPGIRCLNLLAGKGGRNRVKPSVQFEAVRKQYFRKNRMVTEEDIGRLAAETPGVLLKETHAVWKDGKILVTIIPTVPLRESGRKKYVAEVRKYLEQYRLAGTRLEVEIGE